MYYGEKTKIAKLILQKQCKKYIVNAKSLHLFCVICGQEIGGPWIAVWECRRKLQFPIVQEIIQQEVSRDEQQWDSFGTRHIIPGYRQCHTPGPGSGPGVFPENYRRRHRGDSHKRNHCQPGGRWGGFGGGDSSRFRVSDGGWAGASDSCGPGDRRAEGRMFWGVTAGMLNDPDAVTHTLFGQEILVNGYFTSVLGAPALNMGVFVGIISGFAGGMIYNKYYNYRKLPDALAFFNGKRFVPMVVIVWSVIISAVLAVVWPVVQTGINNFGVWIANSSSTSPVLAPFIYGTLERLLLPFGLHHMLTIPMNYTSFGGTYTIQTGINAGSQVFGQDPLWLAWVTDLINFKDAGDMASYTNLMETVIPARFKVGQMIGATGLLLGIALAMYRRVDKDKQANYRSMFFSTVLAVFLTGVTEPLEFMFMFCALPLYVVYAVLQGCAFAMAGIVNLRLHSFGNLEFLTRVPMSLKAGLAGDLINFLIAVVVFFAIGYFVAYVMIDRFKFATPGRLGNYTDEGSDEEGGAGQGGSKGGGNGQAERIIGLLGGRENITLVDACMTRLRVTVKDPEKVADIAAWKAEGALGLLKKDNGIQAVYGPKADVLKSDINDIL